MKLFEFNPFAEYNLQEIFNPEISRRLLTVDNDFAAICKFLIDRLEFKLDSSNIICTLGTYVDDMGNEIESDYDVLMRVNIDKNKYMILDHFNIPVDPKSYPRDVIFFDPINNGKIAKCLFGFVSDKFNLDVAYIFQDGDVLKVTNSRNELILQSNPYRFNLNLPYLDLIFKLFGVYCDLSIYDLDEVDV